jgi:hypothetical protein
MGFENKKALNILCGNKGFSSNPEPLETLDP